ncbi:MAG: hypothetical protein PHD65_02240 [Gallionella sp.]|nr:hypothetical protein [Gallionella sp.]
MRLKHADRLHGSPRTIKKPAEAGFFGYFYLEPVNNCFNIHKLNRTAATAVPIDATSAMIAIFSSREN